MKGRVFKRCPCPAKRDAKGKRVNCRKDHGSWSYVHDAPEDGTGRRRQVTRAGFSTSDEAQEALTQALAAVARGEFIETGQSVPTMAAYLADWLANRRNLRYSTATLYRGHIDNHLTPLLGRLKLTDVRAHHVDRMMTLLASGDPATGREPVGTATARRIFSTLRVALNSAVRKRMLTYNPCSGVELAPEHRDEAQVWERRAGAGVPRSCGGRPACRALPPDPHPRPASGRGGRAAMAGSRPGRRAAPRTPVGGAGRGDDPDGTAEDQERRARRRPGCHHGGRAAGAPKAAGRRAAGVGGFVPGQRPGVRPRGRVDRAARPGQPPVRL
jgi:hypothetical protein